MDIEKLIHCLQCCARVDAHNIGCDDCWLEYCGTECQQLCGTAATALATLQSENASLRAEPKQVMRERLAAYEDTGFEPEEIGALAVKMDIARSAMRNPDAIPTLPHPSGWVSVNERLPSEEIDVLLLVRETEYYGKHGEKRHVSRWVFSRWNIDGEWATTYCHGHKKLSNQAEEDSKIEYKVTHWMPLPDPPEEVTNNAV